VRHYSVLLPLVFSGSWAYTDAGILDRTHLRFFTRKSALQLLQHSRLKNIRGTGKEFGLTSRKGLFNVLTMGLFDDFVTYQHLIAARAEE
jgi:hypothetical protein